MMPGQSRAPKVSRVTLPAVDTPYPSMLDFLDLRFPRVGRDVWRLRLEDGSITDDSGRVVMQDTPYRVNLRLCYYRQVDYEPLIPFSEEIVFQNEEVLVACKPHFLPVIPSGPYVNECLLYRLRKSTGLEDLTPVNRLDRETAGLVVFSVNAKTRSFYSDVFRLRRVRKIYEAIGNVPPDFGQTEWMVESRIVRGEPWFLSKNEDGKPNARTLIRMCESRGRDARFILEPSTGKQHQLRLHMTMIGCRIANDFYYPVLQAVPKIGFEKPLQLLAKELAFTDPLSGRELDFVSSRQLEWQKLA